MSLVPWNEWQRGIRLAPVSALVPVRIVASCPHVRAAFYAASVHPSPSRSCANCNAGLATCREYGSACWIVLFASERDEECLGEEVISPPLSGSSSILRIKDVNQISCSFLSGSSRGKKRGKYYKTDKVGSLS